MRVLLLGPFPPPHGGVQTNLVALRQFLRRRGIHCAVINLTRFRRPDADDVYYPKNALQVLRLLLRLRYEIIHLHFGGNLSRRILGLGFVCSLLPWAKTVFTFHSGGYPSSTKGRSAHRWSLRALVLRRFDQIIAVNIQILEFLHALGVPAERARLVPPHAFLVETVQGNSLPEALGDFLRSHRPVLITVGLLEPEYDLPLQISMLGLVRQTFPEAGLMIVGSGSLEGTLRSLIAASGYAEHVLLCGDVPHAAALEAIARSDLMLRTTLYDGDAISVREALHLGTPVIATDNGMRPQGVRLVPLGDRDTLRAAIAEALVSASPRPRPAASTDEHNLEAVLAAYRELIE